MSEDFLYSSLYPYNYLYKGLLSRNSSIATTYPEDSYNDINTFYCASSNDNTDSIEVALYYSVPNIIKLKRLKSYNFHYSALIVSIPRTDV